MHKKHSKAFTLAEVLIVMAIIGIIAKLTIPALFYDTNSSKFAAGFVKIHNQLDSATKAIVNTAGEETLVGVFSDGNSLMSKYSSVMSVIKTCTVAQGNCWHGAGVEKALGGAVSSIGVTNETGLILSDGTYLLFAFAISNCTDSRFTVNGVNSQCGSIYADVNGAAGPNRVGRDISIFKLASDGIHPGGSQGDAWNSATNVYCNATNTTSADNGYGCPYRILTKGKMDY